MIYGTLQNTPSFNCSSQPTDCTQQVETCHTLLLTFDVPLPILKIPAFLLDCTRQQHSPWCLITPRRHVEDTKSSVLIAGCVFFFLNI